MINNETKKRLKNPEIQVLQDISSLEFNIKDFFKHFYEFSELYLVISSA